MGSGSAILVSLDRRCQFLSQSPILSIPSIP